MDFDGDGRLDLISGSNCCDPRGFILFRRREDGSWEERRELKTTIPDKVAVFDHGRSFVTAADWNGDGVPDLLWMESKDILVGVGPFKDGEPIALAHRIDFSPKIAPGEEYIADFAVADWDRDGEPDLLVRTIRGPRYEAGAISWYKNLGAPGLTKLADGKLLVEFAAEQSANGFCVCDWNADGRLDLVVTRFERLPRKSDDDPWEYRESVWLYPRE